MTVSGILYFVWFFLLLCCKGFGFPQIPNGVYNTFVVCRQLETFFSRPIYI